MNNSLVNRPRSLTCVILAISLTALVLLSPLPAAASGPPRPGASRLNVGSTGTISGTITNAVTGEPVPSVEVEIIKQNQGFAGLAATDPSGQYTVSGLSAGTYFAVAGFFSDYLAELYDELPCYDCTATDGTPIVVQPGETITDVDFTLDLGGILTGTVREDVTGNPITEGEVELFDASLNSVGFDSFSGSNTYQIRGLYPGDVFARVRASGYQVELYDDLPCPASSCNPVTGTPIAVNANTTVAGIDFGLQPLALPTCVPDTVSLCLNEDRFRVEATWRDFAGSSGLGQSAPLTSDTGYFWFFDPGNIELVVKVLNACALPEFQNFWVFASGLTDVEVTLRVTDTESSEVREFVNPLGAAFQPVQETGAFATCP